MLTPSPQRIAPAFARSTGTCASAPASGSTAGGRPQATASGPFDTGDYPNRVMEPLLVRAARREPVERTPVWFMRQAGRSLPEYRAVRERHSFWEVAHTPELCAAVMFADIMTPVLALGLEVELVEGVSPVVADPIRSRADVDALALRGDDAFAPLLDAIRIVRGELAADRAVVGFCGGPFTVAAYLVEGRP